MIRESGTEASTLYLCFLWIIFCFDFEYYICNWKVDWKQIFIGKFYERCAFFIDKFDTLVFIFVSNLGEKLF